MKSLLDQVQKVPIGELRPHPRNPRKGNVTVIAESLQENGQFLPLVVQKSTGYILSGNHTWKAARSIGADTVDVVMVDVDDQQALKILLVANRSSDLGQYDHDVLGEIMTLLEDNLGTGYTDKEMQLLIRATQEATEEVLDAVGDLALPAAAPDYGSIAPTPMNMPGRSYAQDIGYEDDEEDGFEEREQLDLTEQASHLPGVLQLTPNVRFDGWGKWEIPKLLPHRLVTELPSPLKTWAGSATRDEPDPDVWWLYNYGIDSMSGMRDRSKVVLSFYANDEYIDPWWNNPAGLTTKALNHGIQMALTPNYSADGMSRAESLFQLYKSRWVGRFLQEAGIYIIPDVTWRTDDPEFLEMVCKSLPGGTPIIAMQAQNITQEAIKKDPGRIDALADEIEYVIDIVSPDRLLLYAGNPGAEWIRSLNLPCVVQHMQTRINIMGNWKTDKRKAHKEGMNA